MKKAAEYPRRILLAVTGLSPQVVTETLYALICDESDPFVPTEIHLVTTSEGRERAELALLSHEPGWFARFCRDYRLPSIAFDAAHIHVPSSGNGEALVDIRKPEDNERIADYIIELVRELSLDEDAILHVSIAGGRKTMGYYLGYALSLFGREQDQLSHVLVSEPFESSWDFFYPTPYSKIITSRDNKLADTANAEVTLARIPFVRLRDELPQPLLQERTPFSRVVRETQNARPVGLRLRIADRTLVLHGQELSLSASLFAFYWLLASRAKEGRPAVHWTDPDLAADYLQKYRTIVGEFSGDYDRAENTLGKNFGRENFDPNKSRINEKILALLGRSVGTAYTIHTLDRIPNTNYKRQGLTLTPEQIEFL